MRVKLEWLNELVDLSNISIEELVNTISLYSIEVEGIDKICDGTNLVVGHVLTKTPHPDSDHLNVLSVNVGTEVLQIVCGAPNVNVGQYVIVALIGAVLPNDFKIKKSKIRGVESYGMVCSLQEIGMDKKFIPSKYEKGIYYFEDEVLPGTNALKALNFDDFVIELGLTPNRADMFSMLGVAIEFSAVFNRPLKPLVYSLIHEEKETSNKVSVKSLSDSCLSYYASYVEGVCIKESPSWLSSRLTAFGCRSINNVVDITNYILALFGQPLHAFDADLLGENIVIRNAFDNEKITTLDSVERSLIKSDLVITDGKKPVALAGVMGSKDSEVTCNTKNIVIEAAVFDPMTIRKTSTRLNLKSEASIRYERGVDLNRTVLALDYANYLLKELCNAKIYKNYVHVGINKIDNTVIDITSDEINQLLGTNISLDEIVSIYKRLGFGVELKEKLLKVSVPNRRLDVKVKADLIEEVAKLYGYEKLPVTLPIDAMVGKLSNVQKRRRKIRHELANLGFKEVISYSLVPKDYNQIFTLNHDNDSTAIELMMPLSEDHKELRKSLLPSVIDIAKYNVARKNNDIAVFEVGKVYSVSNGINHEEESLAILMSGRYSDTLWNGKVENVDFYLLKGIVDGIFSDLDVQLTYTPIENKCLQMHPKRTASLSYNGKVIGFMGELHPKYLKDNDLEDTYVLEIKLSDILQYEKPITKYKTISKTPIVERDLAIVVDKNILVGNIIETVKSNDKLITDVKVFDVYKGDKISSNQKSIAIKVILNADETLTDEIINKKIDNILKTLEKKYNAFLRA